MDGVSKVKQIGISARFCLTFDIPSLSTTKYVQVTREVLKYYNGPSTTIR